MSTDRPDAGPVPSALPMMLKPLLMRRAMPPMKPNRPVNRLIGDMPKVGIRPTIDGRRKGVRESLEKATMGMAKSAARLIESSLRHANGLSVECVVADACIGGVAE